MKELELLMDNFINENISLEEYINCIKSLEITDQKAFQNYICSYNNTTKMDQRMHALLILWFYKYQYFNNLSYEENHYLDYINEITYEIIDYNIKILILENSYLIYKMDNFYFIINHNNHLVKITLPDELKQQIVFCINCNDEMKLKEKITMPEFSFYAMEKI